MSISSPSPVPAPPPQGPPFSCLRLGLSLPDGPCGWGHRCVRLCEWLLCAQPEVAKARPHGSRCQDFFLLLHDMPSWRSAAFHPSHPGSAVGWTSVLRCLGLVLGAELPGVWPAPQRPPGSTTHHGGGSTAPRLCRHWRPPVPACGRFSQGPLGAGRPGHPPARCAFPFRALRAIARGGAWGSTEPLTPALDASSFFSVTLFPGRVFVLNSLYKCQVTLFTSHLFVNVEQSLKFSLTKGGWVAPSRAL